MSTERPSLDQQRQSNVLRTVLITYGVAVYTALQSSFDSGDTPWVLGINAAPHSLVLAGLGVQLLLVAARAVIKRYAPDTDAAAQGPSVISVVGDGATVLLFAVGTLGALISRVSGL